MMNENALREKSMLTSHLYQMITSIFYICECIILSYSEDGSKQLLLLIIPSVIDVLSAIVSFMNYSNNTTNTGKLQSTLNGFVLDYEARWKLYRLLIQEVITNVILVNYYTSPLFILFIFLHFFDEVGEILFINFEKTELMLIFLVYLMVGALTVKRKLHFFFIPIMLVLLLICFVFITYYILDLQHHPETNLDWHLVAINKMALVLKTAFVNSLPKRLIPLIMTNQKLPCEIAENITTVYIHIKNNDDLLKDPASDDARLIISKINFLLCTFDFLAEATGVEKIKSSYSYYMACAGAKRHFLGESTEEVYNQKDEFKLLTTFCLACQEVASLFTIKIAAGITSGNAVIGVIGLENRNINLDIYGDIINLSARIARNAESGIFFALKNNKECEYKRINSAQSIEPEISSTGMKELIQSCDYEEIEEMIIQAEPFYQFGSKTIQNYKGKGERSIIRVEKTELFSECFLGIFRCAFEKLFAYCNTQTDYENKDFRQFVEEFTAQKQQQSPGGAASQIATRDRENAWKAEGRVNTNRLLNETRQVILDMNKINQIREKYNKEQALEMQKRVSMWLVSFDTLSFQKVDSSYSCISPQHEERESPIASELAHELEVDYKFDSDDEITPSRITNTLESQRMYELNQIHISDSSVPYSAIESSIADSSLNPKLANFLQLAKTSNDIRRESSTSSKISKVSVEEEIGQVRKVATVSKIEPEQQEQPKDDCAISISLEEHRTLTNQLTSLSKIAAKFAKQKQSQESIEQNINKLFEEYPLMFNDNKYKYKHLTEQLFFVSRYLRKSLSKQPQYYQEFIIHQKAFIMSYTFTIFIGILIFVKIAENFFKFPRYSVVLFGEQVNIMNFYLGTLQLLLLCNLIYNVLFRSLFEKQKVLQERPNKRNAQRLLEFCSEYYSELYVMLLTVSFALLNLRLTVIASTIGEPHLSMVFNLYNQFQVLLLCTELLLKIVISVIYINYKVAPTLLISRTYCVFIVMELTFLLFTLVRHPECFLVFAFSSALIVLFTIPEFTQHLTISMLNFKLSEEINEGRNLLKLILPTITIDSLLASSAPEQLQEMISQFPFLLNYKDSIVSLIDFTTALNQDVNYTQFREPRNDLQQLIFGFLLMPNPLSFSQERPLINFKNAAYLNLDIANFTEFSSNITVEETLQFLTSLYQKFDSRIEKAQNLIEIKISGDSYELMSLPCALKKYEDNERLADEFAFSDPVLQNIFKTPQALRMSYDAIVCLIAVGLGFITDCQQVINEEFEDPPAEVALRVGISFGAVSGALLGNRLCRFDVFGTVPREAEEMQESALVNTVRVSELVQQILTEGERAFCENLRRIQAQSDGAIDAANELVKFNIQHGCVTKIV